MYQKENLIKRTKVFFIVGDLQWCKLLESQCFTKNISQCQKPLWEWVFFPCKVPLCAQLWQLAAFPSICCSLLMWLCSLGHWGHDWLHICLFVWVTQCLPRACLFSFSEVSVILSGHAQTFELHPSVIFPFNFWEISLCCDFSVWPSKHA